MCRAPSSAAAASATSSPRNSVAASSGDQRRIGQQPIGKGLETSLTSDLRLGPPLRLVGQVDVFDTRSLPPLDRSLLLLLLPPLVARIEDCHHRVVAEAITSLESHGVIQMRTDDVQSTPGLTAAAFDHRDSHA